MPKAIDVGRADHATTPEAGARRIERRQPRLAHARALGPIRARRLHQAALAIKREVGDRANLAWSLTYLADLMRQEGDRAKARSLHEESLARRRDLG